MVKLADVALKGPRDRDRPRVLFAVVPTSMLNEHILGSSVQRGPTALRLSADGSLCVLKFMLKQDSKRGGVDPTEELMPAFRDDSTSKEGRCVWLTHSEAVQLMQQAEWADVEETERSEDLKRV